MVLPATGCLRGRPRGLFTAETPTAEVPTAAAAAAAGRDDDVTHDVTDDVADRRRVDGLFGFFGAGERRSLAAGMNLTGC